MTDYSHLSIDPGQHRKDRKKIELLCGLPLLAKGLELASRGAASLGRQGASLAFVLDRWLANRARLTGLDKTRDLLRRDSLEAGSFGSSYGYSEETEEIKTNQYYRHQLLKKELGIFQRTESFDLYELSVRTLGEMIEQGGCAKVINFGVSYAHVDSLLAARFPGVSFVGIDRSPATAAYNQKYFGHVPNMSFVASDIFAYLAHNDCSGALLYHMRTGAVLPPSFLKKLYGVCREAGVGQLACFEPFGISWDTGRPFVFSDQELPSQVFRGIMFLHNYPGLLKAAGYEATASRMHKTTHKDDDYRILSITARRAAAS